MATQKSNTQKKKNTSTRKTAASKGRNSSSVKRPVSQKKSPVTNENYVVFNEVFLVAGIALSLLFLLSSFGVVGSLGKIVNTITFGLMGVIAYIFPFVLVFGVFIITANKGNSLSKKKFAYSMLFICVMSAMVSLFNSNEELKTIENFEYCAQTKSSGGLIGAFIANILQPIIGFWGSFIVLSAAIIILLILISEKLIVTDIFGALRDGFDRLREYREYEPEDDYEEYEPRSRGNSLPKRRKPAKTFVFTDENGKKDLSEDEIHNDVPQKSSKKKHKKEKKLDLPTLPAGMREFSGQTKDNNNSATAFDKNIDSIPEKFINKSTGEIYEQELLNKFGNKSENMEYAIDNILDSQKLADEVEMIEAAKDYNNLPEISVEPDIIPEPEIKQSAPVYEQKLPEENVSEKIITPEKKSLRDDKVQSSMPSITTTDNSNYKYPPLNLLTLPKGGIKTGVGREHQLIAKKLQDTLTSFGVKVSINDISVGPTVTRYEIQPEQGVKVSKITNLADDIKLNLAATDIRIEAPIPGKAAVGIEVPNKENSAVLLRELFESKQFQESSSSIAFAVGKDLAGQPVVTDIAKMPHLLIAGQTGSGKSVCINTLIMSILYKYHPDDVKLIMIDPKVVELSVYNGIPHLLIPVVTDPKKASGALNWAVAEMVERYNKFAALGVRDMKGYNKRVSSVEKSAEEGYEIMPQIVIIVDELADLMMVAPGEVEDAICRLAQMARAAGIHLIIATQRPSVNVITGLIKANIPSRIAFSVASAIDSRTVLDGGGAEKLLGKGDMLFYPSGYPKPVRLQGAFISDSEVSSVVEFLSGNNTNEYSSDIITKIESQTSSASSTSASDKPDNERDQYFAEAGRFIIEKDKASIGMLQRVYKIGFNRAARIMDQLCDAGVVGPEEGTKPRKVLMSLEEFEQYIEEYV